MQLSIIDSEVHSARELSRSLQWKLLLIKTCPVKIKYRKFFFLICLKEDREKSNIGKKIFSVKNLDINTFLFIQNILNGKK